MTIETLGIDIAKNVFQLHGVNRNGRVLLKRRVLRDQLLAVLAQIGPCTIVIEACTGAFYWARKFEALGHRVKVISPQYIKPFVRRQKNDGNDAEAICIAARQPHIPFLPKKTVAQQDIQALHRARQRMVNHRTAVVSQIRGLLLDRGFAIAKSITRARRAIPEIISDLKNELRRWREKRSASSTIFFVTLIVGLRLLIRRSSGYFVKASPANELRKLRALGRSPPPRSLPPLATVRSSRMGGISPLGLALSHASIRAAIARC